MHLASLLESSSASLSSIVALKLTNQRSRPFKACLSQETCTSWKVYKDVLIFIRRFISNLAGRCQPFSRLMKKDVLFVMGWSMPQCFWRHKKVFIKSTYPGGACAWEAAHIVHCRSGKFSLSTFGTREWIPERMSTLLPQSNSHRRWVELLPNRKYVPRFGVRHPEAQALHACLHHPPGC